MEQNPQGAGRQVFTFEATREQHGTITVLAATVEEALEKAQKAVEAGKVTWYDYGDGLTFENTTEFYQSNIPAKAPGADRGEKDSRQPQGISNYIAHYRAALGEKKGPVQNEKSQYTGR